MHSWTVSLSRIPLPLVPCSLSTLEPLRQFPPTSLEGGPFLHDPLAHSLILSRLNCLASAQVTRFLSFLFFPARTLALLLMRMPTPSIHVLHTLGVSLLPDWINGLLGFPSFSFLFLFLPLLFFLCLFFASFLPCSSFSVFPLPFSLFPLFSSLPSSDFPDCCSFPLLSLL